MRSSRKWYVFYTYPKFEKKVHDYLIKENYESFLPMHWVVRQWSDRKKRLHVPMFPNYIFVQIERNRIYEILKVPKIIDCVKFNKIPAFIRQKDVEHIKRIAKSEYSIKVTPNLKVGDSIIIIDGALTGMEGILVEERGNKRFAVQVSSLQQSIMVDVPLNCMEILEAVTY